MCVCAMRQTHSVSHRIRGTTSNPKQWFTIDLGETTRLHPTAYTMRHGVLDIRLYLTRWTLDASVNGVEWLTLHTGSAPAFAGASGTKTFAVPPYTTSTSDAPSTGFRFFRVHQRGRTTTPSHPSYTSSAYGNGYMSIAGFELYGKLERGVVPPPRRFLNSLRMQLLSASPYLPDESYVTRYDFSYDFDRNGVIYDLVAGGMSFIMRASTPSQQQHTHHTHTHTHTSLPQPHSPQPAPSPTPPRASTSPPPAASQVHPTPCSPTSPQRSCRTLGARLLRL